MGGLMRKTTHQNQHTLQHRLLFNVRWNRAPGRHGLSDLVLGRHAGSTAWRVRRENETESGSHYPA